MRAIINATGETEAGGATSWVVCRAVARRRYLRLGCRLCDPLGDIIGS